MEKGRFRVVALMLSEFLYYLLGILAMVGGILLLERLVAGPHTTSGTGYARVDSVFDFDQLPGEAVRRPSDQPAGRADAQPFRFCGTSLTTTGALGRSANSSSRSPASSVPSTAHRNGSTGTSGPVNDRARARLGSVLVVMREGEPLPPIEVWAWHGEYYVLDGHHRVAAARAWVGTTSALMSLKWAETATGRRTDARRLSRSGAAPRASCSLRNSAVLGTEWQLGDAILRTG